MGKDRVIKQIANLLAQETAHKILRKYTKDPKTINHLSGEINNYQENQIPELVEEYNWNNYDKDEIKNFDIKQARPLKLQIKPFYPNAKENEARELLLQALEWKEQKDKEEKRNQRTSQ